MLMFLVLEGCLVLGAPRTDEYSNVGNYSKIEGFDSRINVGSFPTLKVVNYGIRKSENLSMLDSVSVYFNKVDKSFILDSIAEYGNYVVFYRKFRIGDMKWYNKYSGEIQINVYKDQVKFEQKFAINKMK